jgi:hypothetical protein
MSEPAWETKMKNNRTMTFEETRAAWTEILLLRAGVSNEEKPLLTTLARALTAYAPEIAERLARRFQHDANKKEIPPDGLLLSLLEFEEKEWWET